MAPSSSTLPSSSPVAHFRSVPLSSSHEASPQSSPLPFPSSSPGFDPRSSREDLLGPHPLSSSHLPLLAQPSATVRHDAFANYIDAPPSPSNTKRRLCLHLYLAYALIEVVATVALLSLYWGSPCASRLSVWVLVHTARWAVSLPLALRRWMRAAPAQGAVVGREAVELRRWGKYAVFAWWIVGVYWLVKASSPCEGERSVLFSYSLVLVVLYGVRLALPILFLLALCLCLPCLLLLIKPLQPNPGASKEAIDTGDLRDPPLGMDEPLEQRNSDQSIDRHVYDAISCTCLFLLLLSFLSLVIPPSDHSVILLPT